MIDDHCLLCLGVRLFISGVRFDCNEKEVIMLLRELCDQLPEKLRDGLCNVCKTEDYTARETELFQLLLRKKELVREMSLLLSDTARGNTE